MNNSTRTQQVCFLCSRSSDNEIVEADSGGRRKERRIRRRNNNNSNSKVDFEQCSSSSNPHTENAGKRILLKYLVGRCEDEELKVNLLISPNLPIKFCNECKELAKEVQDLHLQLEIIQMRLIDKLKKVKELIVQNSQKWESEGRSVRNEREVDNDGEEVARLIQLACQFRTFIGNDDTNQVDIPLVFLEKFVGSKTFPEIVSSTSKPNHAKQMQTKHIKDCQPNSEYIPEQIQEFGAGDSTDSTVPVKDKTQPQSKQLVRGEYWTQQVKEDLEEVDENPAGDDDDSDVDFDPASFQSDSKDSTSPELSSPISRTRKTGSNYQLATSDKKHIRCESCGRMYENFSKLISHSRLIHRGTNLSCALCSNSDETKLYSLRDELPRHLDDIHGVSCLRIECDFPSCSQRLYNLQNFKRHKLSHLKRDNNPLLRCNSCSASFRSAYSLSRHKMLVHGHSKLKCEVCPPSPGRYFSTPTGLGHHHLYAHQKKDGENFPCSKCPKVFPLKTGRDQHEKLSHGERKFTCDKCGYTTRAKSKLERHSRTVHVTTSPTICESCGFAAKHEKSLEHHRRRMHDPEYQLQLKIKLAVKKFECSECPKKFTFGVELRRHMLAHSVMTPFQCDLCGQAFKVERSLKEHMLSLHGHGDATLHNCSQCSKSFPSKTRLTKHMMSHSDERKFACNLCGKRFQIKLSLKLHMMNVHGIGASVKKERRRKYVCEECAKEFSRSSNLKRHMLVHANKRREGVPERGVRKQVGVASVAAPSHVKS